MMSKSNSSWKRWLRAFYILPLICGALALNARTVINYEVSENSSNSVIKIEVKQDSNGEDRIYVMNEEVSINEIADVVSSLINGDESKVVEIVAQGDIKYGIIHDIKESLRKISALKVKYNCPDVESVTRNLPPNKEIADRAGIEVIETWEEIQSEPKENRHYVRINENDRVLFDSSVINIEDIMGLVAEVRRANHQGKIFYQVNVGTSYGACVTAQKEISDAVTGV